MIPSIASNCCRLPSMSHSQLRPEVCPPMRGYGPYGNNFRRTGAKLPRKAVRSSCRTKSEPANRGPHACHRRCRTRGTMAMHMKPGVQIHGTRVVQSFLVYAADAEVASTPFDLSAASGTKSNKDEKMSSLKGIFPGGLRRAEVQIPGLVMNIRTIDVLGSGSKEFLDMVDSAVASGFTMVILQSRGGETEDESSSSGARLYEAACLLKSVIRGRALLLVEERVDIAAAAGVNGVLLSDQGLPAVVARGMMQNVSSDNSMLPLVARSVKSAQSALLATASEGADLLVLQMPQEDGLDNIVSSISEQVSIPVFSQESISSLSSILTTDKTSFRSIEAGATGIIYDGIDVKIVASDKIGTLTSSLVDAMNSVRNRLAGISRPPQSDTQDVSTISTAEESSSGTSSLDILVKGILDEEYTVLESLIALMKEAYPEMEEVSLLVDAVAQLSEPFLLMVVGEFNSGKSSVINALLGKRYLAEGVLPTTNEIALLKYAGDGADARERSERHPDGHFIYYLPAELLKEINIVDTPGTNVILKRQQRLTEEFVPRADLVLFVLSADRPFTASEMAFLQYIRQWDKKITFLLNKSDIFLHSSELKDVLKFVQDNAQQALSIEQTTIYAVSARQAFHAKAEVTSADGTIDCEKLQNNAAWNSSGFWKLEEFITNFLDGSSDAGAERRRLKLATPLGIALTLLEACGRQLSVNLKEAELDLETLDGLFKQLDNYEKAMESDGAMKCQRLSAMIGAAKDRANRFVDSVLRVSNIDAVARYLLGGDRTGTMPVAGSFDDQVMGSVLRDVQSLLEEHSFSLENSVQRTVSSYQQILLNRWPDVKQKEKNNGEDINTHYYSDKIEPFKKSLRVLDGFDSQAAKIVLEEELRDVVITTFGGLGAAGVSASVLTSILPSTLEDLVALALCSAGGFIGVWNLPNRRNEVKGKMKKVADSFASQLEAAIEAEVKDTIVRLRKEVEEMMRPYLESAQAESERLKGLQDRVVIGNGQLESLQKRVQSIGSTVLDS